MARQPQSAGYWNKGRLVLAAFGAAALALILTPLIARWEVSRDACPRETIGQGYFPDSMYWRISKAECGGAIGTVWQVHISAPDAQPRLAFDAQNGPVPLAVGQTRDAVIIKLDEAPDGATSASVTIPIVPKMRPKTVLHFINGRMREHS